MRSLLLNLRRIVAGAEREHGRYAELLRLVHWFDEADDATAHALWASVFGLDPSRHVGFAVTEADEHTPPTTSWLAGPRAQVPVMLRETGQRRIAGRSGRAEDFTEAKQRRLAEHARREEARRRAEHARREEARRRAVAEIARHRGRLERVRLSDAAREALLDLVLSRCGELTGG
ncbi:MAG: DUF2397 domain-containing protein [Intrasporangium sp.]|nr:DUF2397 domain-containing protein [Intrasporangium sp.]